MWEKRKEDVPRPASIPQSPANQPVSRPAPPQVAHAVSHPLGGTATIGKAMAIKGNIYSEEDLYIDGEVEGTLELNGHKLTIGPSGRAVASVNAREVVVQGTIEGDVAVTERISIRKDGNVVGDIKAAGIVIDDGAFFKGNIDILRAQGKPAGDMQPNGSVPVAVSETKR